MNEAEEIERSEGTVVSLQIPSVVENAHRDDSSVEKQPRTFTFGSVEVHEAPQTDLLTTHEKKLFHGGFETLKEIVGGGNNIERMVLTNPDIVSGVVGLQPLVSIDTGEAVLLYQSFRKVGYDFEQDYTFLEFGKERSYLKLLVNDRAAEHVLRTHHREFDITLPDHPLQKEDIIENIKKLLNSPDVKQANLVHGLLSGFPVEDCQYWVNRRESPPSPIHPLKRVTDVESRFVQETAIEGSDKVLRVDPISLLNPNDYEMTSSKNQFLPDTRAALTQDADVGIVEGFGLRWLSPLPVRESTMKHCQKLLQVDRELGLLDYVNKQRDTFSSDDNIGVITTQKSLLEGTGMKLGKGALGAVFGIFALFSTMETLTKQPEKEGAQQLAVSK